jgi:hypothetical protein
VFQETRSKDPSRPPSTTATPTSSRRASATSSCRRRPRPFTTAIAPEQIERSSPRSSTPRRLHVHPKPRQPQLQRRAQMVADGAIDWGMGEALAFGSLLMEGRTVRLAGQDSRRGTFGHRHMVIVDKETGWQYKPLKQCSPQRRRSSTSTTRCSASTRRWASSTATRSPAPMRWSCGRRSSATSPTARRRSSTSSSPPASRSGASSPPSCCCCRTATRARAPTTPQRGSSASCRCAPRTT